MVPGVEKSSINAAICFFFEPFSEEAQSQGTMRNVGGKAGGFINKKFFHPSSIRNQDVGVCT